jgi:hypothetical protein
MFLRSKFDFDIEQPRVALLMQRLGLAVDKYEAPNTEPGSESGADVVVVIDGHRIGIQVTDLDTGEELGHARAAETRLARDAAGRGSTYGTFAQNDPRKVVAAIKRSISRKARMSFAGFDEFWLLLCCGVPEFGAIAATFVMTPWLDTASLDHATLDKLARSKYSRAFIHAILGAEEKALYQWRRDGRWSKSTQPLPAEEQGPDFWEYKNDGELLSNPDRWSKREVEKVLGRKRANSIAQIQSKPEQAKKCLQYHTVYWTDRTTEETKSHVVYGVRDTQRHAMIFACAVIKSKTRPLDVWVVDEQGLRVADCKKIADFANANGYL